MPSPIVSTLPKEYPQLEQTSGQYRATITDEAGATLPGSLLLTLTLTLYALDAAHTIVNSRDAQNVLNTNGVTATDAATENLTWTIAPADNVILNDALAYEKHVARFDYTWGAGYIGRHEIVLSVRNLVRVA
jgi:hypothetical protein